MVTTRRGRQFNSMVQGDRDGHTGAGRDAVLINPDDAIALGAVDGTPVVLRSDSGEMAGRARIAPVTRGTLQVHWPEGADPVGPAPSRPGLGYPGLHRRGARRGRDRRGRSSRGRKRGAEAVAGSGG